MARTNEKKEQDERLREVIRLELDERGKFTLLEAMSGIPAHKWKNFFYRKQGATEEMVYFLSKKYPEAEAWVEAGKPDLVDADFGYLPPSAATCETVSNRLNWVIKEWASPKGEQLFQYLEEKAQGKVSAKKWANLVLGLEEPTVEMIQVVCSRRPHFTEWIILGRVSGDGQVNPADETSIAEWRKHQKERYKTFYEAGPLSIKDSMPKQKS